jgi:hypothetical protein
LAEEKITSAIPHDGVMKALGPSVCREDSLDEDVSMSELKGMDDGHDGEDDE